VVSATDVRAAAGEQVESLGAKFIMTDALKDASGTGGYARELTLVEQQAQAELVSGHIAKQDIVVTTALIPGRPAPKLVTRAMVESMGPGSVIVDLAAERGGNVELTRPDEVVEHNGVTIIGFTNLASRIPTTASQLYAKNLLSFLETLIDKKEKQLAINWDDELVKATVLTRDGAVVHPNFAKAEPVAAKAEAPVAVAKPTPKTPSRKVEPKSAPVKTGAAEKAPAAKPAAKAPARKTAAKPAEPAAVAAPVAKAEPVKKPAAKKAAVSATAKPETAAAAPTAKPRAAKKPAATAETAPAVKTPAAKKPAAKKPASKKPAASEGGK
jgi:NAD(P) transhydrogenase subunit alpha